MIVDHLENHEKESHCHIHKMNFYNSKICTLWDLQHLVQEEAVKHPKSNKRSGLTPISWNEKMTFKTLKDLMEKLPAERLKIVYSKGEMKESSCLVTSTKIQKHIVTALQLL